MKLEPMEPRWASPELKEHYESLQRQIAEAFRLPPWALSDAIAREQFLHDLRLRTALLERELVGILERFTSPRAMIVKED